VVVEDLVVSVVRNLARLIPSFAADLLQRVQNDISSRIEVNGRPSAAPGLRS